MKNLLEFLLIIAMFGCIAAAECIPVLLGLLVLCIVLAGILYGMEMNEK